MGAPTKYRQEYCQIIIDKMSMGESATQVANMLKVDRDRFDDWAKVWPEWAEAYSLAKQAAQSFWEARYMEIALDPTLKSTAPVKALEFLMASRFRKDYQKSTASTQNIEIKHITQMTDNDLDMQIQRLLPKATTLDSLTIDAEDGEIVE